VDTHGTKRLGVGLGLAIVKEVARLLDFKVRIVSTVGKSTEVSFSSSKDSKCAALLPMPKRMR
jgi:signal transduction histidine kinase